MSDKKFLKKYLISLNHHVNAACPSTPQAVNPVKTNKYPRIYIRVTPTEAKQFKELMGKGLSARDVICHISRPCSCCKGTEVIAYDKNDNEIKIKRGILVERR